MNVQFVSIEVKPKSQSLIVCAGTLTCSTVEEMGSGFVVFKKLFNENTHVDEANGGWDCALNGMLTKFHEGEEAMSSYVRIAKQNDYIGGVATVPVKGKKGLISNAMDLVWVTKEEAEKKEVAQYEDAVRLAALDAIRLKRPLYIQPLGIGVYGWEPEQAAQLFVKVLNEVDVDNQLDVTIPLYNEADDSNDQRFKNEFKRAQKRLVESPKTQSDDLIEKTSKKTRPHHFIDANALQIQEAFIKVYNALYNGQTSFFKGRIRQFNYEELVSFAEANPRSRTAEAWRLTKLHYPNISPNNLELFKAIHQYSYAHSSILFFSRSVFSKGYDQVEDKIAEASEDSRTGQIIKALG